MEEILKVENLRKSFGGVNAVDGCSFAVEKGKITALIGPNGAGKTTVFDLISGFLTPDAGSIVFQDRRIDRLAVWTRSRLGIARTFQQVRLFLNLTLRDNIALAMALHDDHMWRGVLQPHLKEFEDGVLLHALQKVGIDRVPDTLASALSYGQQKLLEFARALAFPHTLLMLDEPVAGIAPPLRLEMVRIIEDLKHKGETMLIIEHDMDFIMQLADIVVVMHEGKVLMEGTPEEVKKHPQVLEAYLGEQL